MSVLVGSDRLVVVRERAPDRLRLGAALFLLLASLLGGLGLAWDIRWHGAVGRDQFWTPPHVLIYGSVFFAGLTCLAMVLLETWRHRQGWPGVDDRSTIGLFGLFHAPLGFVVAGFGYLTLLVAAPLDDYWHQLYGIDVELWAPFHVMGLIGAAIGALGLVQVSAALTVRARRRGAPGRRVLGFTGLEWLTFLALSGLIHLLVTTASPGTWQHPALALGPFQTLTYPLLLALFLVPLMVAAVRFAGRPGAATAVLALFGLRQTAFALFVPWVIRLMVAQQGLDYRLPGQAPQFRAVDLLGPVLFLLVALVVDLVAARRKSALRLPTSGLHGLVLAGLAVALPLYLAALLLVSQVVAAGRSLGIPPEIVLPPPPGLPAYLGALPLTLLATLLATWIGGGLGTVLRLNER